jgi:hypothetical protein
MRWLFLLLPEVLVLFLFLALRHPEAPPLEISTKKVSDKELPEKDPIAFLEKCLARYDREVSSYSAIFYKQELIQGRMQKPEEIQIHFHEKPFSVYFEWLKGARKAERCVYVEGENHNMFLARPLGPLVRLVVGDVAERELDSPDAKAASRYSFRDFGLKKVMEQTLEGWHKAKARGALHIDYLGIHTVKEAGNRACYKLRRSRYEHPEDGGVTELTVYIDKETLLQVGTVLHGEEDNLIAFYFFRDIHLNPNFAKNYFTRSALTP